MHWFNKDTVCKQEIFSDNAVKSLLSKKYLLSNVSDALSPVLLPAAKFVTTGEKVNQESLSYNFYFCYFFVFIFTHNMHFVNLFQISP